MKDIVAALLAIDAIGASISLLITTVIAILMLGANKIIRLKRRRRRLAMLELKQDLKRIA